MVVSVAYPQWLRAFSTYEGRSAVSEEVKIVGAFFSPKIPENMQVVHGGESALRWSLRGGFIAVRAQ